MRTATSVRHMNMCEGPLFKKIVVFTIPIMLSGLLQLLFNAADLMVVGNFCGSNSVGAVGSTASLVNLLVNFFVGISSGAGATVAISIGAGDSERTRKTVHTIIPLALVCGVVLTVLGLLFTGPILNLMGTPAEMLPLAKLYTQIYFCGTVSSMVYNFGAAVLRADGDTKRPLYYLTLSGVLNVVLNVVFVTAFRMDVGGVALATILSQTLSALLVLHALLHREGDCRFFWRDMRFDKQQLRSVLRLGVPAGIQSSTFSVANIIIQSSVNSFGGAAIAGSAAASNITGFLHTATNAFHQTALNFVGQNYGAKKFDRIKKTMWICVLCAASLGLLIGVLMYAFAPALLSLYITDSAEAIRYGAERMLYATVPYFLCSTLDVFTGAMRGMGSSTLPMFITIFANCLMRMIWVFTVFAYFGTWISLYLAYPVSWGCAVIVIIISFVWLFKKRKRQMMAEE